MHRSRLSVRKRPAKNNDWPVKSQVPHKHVLQWVVEPVETEPSFLQKHMFGCQGIYLFGRLVSSWLLEQNPGAVSWFVHLTSSILHLLTNIPACDLTRY